MYTFNPATIDEHIERYGVDIHPAIDLQADKEAMQRFFNEVSEKFPRHYERIVQSSNQFQIQKEIVFPGKGKIDVPTFNLLKRGPAFEFPRQIAAFEEDIEWGQQSLNGVVIDSLKLLKNRFPASKFVRLGKIRSIIFPLNDQKPDEVLRQQFTLQIPANAEGINIGWNQSDEKYNHRIQASVVTLVDAQDGKPRGQGIKVVLDINNRKIAPLDNDALNVILAHADDFYKNKFFNVLNGE